MQLLQRLDVCQVVDVPDLDEFVVRRAEELVRAFAKRQTLNKTNYGIEDWVSLRPRLTSSHRLTETSLL